MHHLCFRWGVKQSTLAVNDTCTEITSFCCIFFIDFSKAGKYTRSRSRCQGFRLFLSENKEEIFKTFHHTPSVVELVETTKNSAVESTLSSTSSDTVLEKQIAQGNALGYTFFVLEWGAFVIHDKQAGQIAHSTNRRCTCTRRSNQSRGSTRRLNYRV